MATPLQGPETGMARNSFGPRAARRLASPWRLGGLSVRELARRVWQEIDNDELLDRAAALSYYFIFAMFRQKLPRLFVPPKRVVKFVESTSTTSPARC